MGFAAAIEWHLRDRGVGPFSQLPFGYKQIRLVSTYPYRVQRRNSPIPHWTHRDWTQVEVIFALWTYVPAPVIQATDDALAAGTAYNSLRDAGLLNLTRIWITVPLSALALATVSTPYVIGQAATVAAGATDTAGSTGAAPFYKSKTFSIAMTGSVVGLLVVCAGLFIVRWKWHARRTARRRTQPRQQGAEEDAESSGGMSSVPTAAHMGNTVSTAAVGNADDILISASDLFPGRPGYILGGIVSSAPQPAGMARAVHDHPSDLPNAPTSKLSEPLGEELQASALLAPPTLDLTGRGKLSSFK